MSDTDHSDAPAEADISESPAPTVEPIDWILPLDAAWDRRVFNGLLLSLLLGVVMWPLTFWLLAFCPRAARLTVSLLLGIPVLYLYWMQTSAHPAKPEWLDRTRRLARAGMVVGYVPPVFCLYVALSHVKITDEMVATYGFLSILSMAWMLVGLWYVVRLARRVGSWGVASVLRVFFWIAAFTVVVSIFWQAESTVLGWRRALVGFEPDVLREKMVLSVKFTGVFYTIIGLPFFFLLRTLRRRMKGELRRVPLAPPVSLIDRPKDVTVPPPIHRHEPAQFVPSANPWTSWLPLAWGRPLVWGWGLVVLSLLLAVGRQIAVGLLPISTGLYDILVPCNTLVLAAGVFLMTTPKPDDTGWAGRLRWITRAVMAMTLIVSVVGTLSEFGHVRALPIGEGAYDVSPGTMIFGVTMVLLMVYEARFSKVLGRKGLQTTFIIMAFFSFSSGMAYDPILSVTEQAGTYLYRPEEDGASILSLLLFPLIPLFLLGLAMIKEMRLPQPAQGGEDESPEAAA